MFQNRKGVGSESERDKVSLNDTAGLGMRHVEMYRTARISYIYILTRIDTFQSDRPMMLVALHLPVGFAR
jgi:hypothetical protein